MKASRRQVYRRVGLSLPPPSLISQCTRLYDVPGTHNTGLPTQYRLNVGPASQPIAVSMPVIHIRCWPNIRTELGDCPVFALTAIWVTFLYHQKGHYLDNTIHWPNCEIVNIFSSEDFLNTKVLNLGTLNVIVHMFIIQKCQPFPTHSTPLSPK